jgi:uncharacterized delta-60 repeat protein
MLELLRSLWEIRGRFEPPSSLGQGRFRPRLEPLESRLLPTSGVLDPTFGNGGQVITTFGYSDNVARGVTSYPSGPNRGKVVAVGDIDPGVTVTDSVVARYNTDGSLDTDPTTGFGPLVGGQRTGWVRLHFGDSDQYSEGPNAVALQPGGLGDFKVVVVGGAGVRDPQLHSAFFVARFQNDGELDPTFGTQGVVYSAFHEPPPDNSPRNDIATAITIDPNTNDLLVAGSSHTNGSFGSDINDYALVIYGPDGQTLGGMRTTLGGICGDAASGVALQPNGNIIVVGSTCTGGGIGENGYEWGLASYTWNGGGVQLDQSFGDHGIVRTHFAQQGVRSDDFPSGVVVQPDGNIVVAGTIHFVRSGGDIGMARYRPDGSLDPGFGNGGIVDTGYDFSGSSPLPCNADAVLLQPDGKIVVGGSEEDRLIVPTYDWFAAARFLPDGTFDSSANDPTDPFGPTGSGSVVTPFVNSHGTSFAAAHAITFEEYDTGTGRVAKLVAAGETLQYLHDPNSGNLEFGLARYDLDSMGGGGEGPPIPGPGITPGERASAAPVAVVGAPTQEAPPWTPAADAFLIRMARRTTKAPGGEGDTSLDGTPTLAISPD